MAMNQAQNKDLSYPIAVTDLFFIFTWGDKQGRLRRLSVNFSKHLKGNFQPGRWALNHTPPITADEIHAAWPLPFYLPFNLISSPIVELLTDIFWEKQPPSCIFLDLRVSTHSESFFVWHQMLWENEYMDGQWPDHVIQIGLWPMACSSLPRTPAPSLQQTARWASLLSGRLAGSRTAVSHDNPGS